MKSLEKNVDKVVSGKKPESYLDTFISTLKSSKRKAESTAKSGRKSHSKFLYFL